jgi:hypothetical protein
VGGPGSGRCGGWGGPVVEDATVLDVDRLVRQGLIGPGLYRSGVLFWRNVDTGEEAGSVGYVTDTQDRDGGQFDVSYRLGSERRPVECRIRLETSRPHFGGVRWWFVCPLSGRWVRKLYLQPGCDYFASRQALGLTYRVCREDVGARARRKAEKLWRRLGPERERPKGMHWRTYNRIGSAAEAADALSWDVFLYRCVRLLAID